jgi:hypothetical protein
VVVAVAVVPEEEEAVEFLMYSSRRLPAPQYSRALPVQTMLQSASGAEAELGARLSPQ